MPSRAASGKDSGRREKQMQEEAYRARLRSDLERWRAKAILSPDQTAAILADLPPPRARARIEGAAVVAMLGAALFGLGLITFVGANWGAMAKGVRFAATLALLWALFGGAIMAIERGARGVGTALAVAGVLAIGAAIALVGQTYHIDGEPAGLFLVWAIGALAGAIAFRSRAVLIAYMLTALGYFTLSGAGGQAQGGPGLWLFAAALVYAPLWTAGAFLARRWNSGAGLHLSGFALGVWLTRLCWEGLWGAGERNDLAASLLLAAAGAAVALAGEAGRRRGEGAGAVALAWGAGIALLGAGLAQSALTHSQGPPVWMIAAAAILAVTAWGAAWGDAPGRRGARAAAITGFALECLYIYVTLFSTLLNTALFLLGGGTVLFLLALAWLRLPRREAALEDSP